MIPAHPGLANGPVYLDYNATTPVDPRVVEAVRPYLVGWFGNPSSDHPYAAEPKAALCHARAQVAALIGAQADEIVFTGSGSEADNLAPRGAGPVATYACVVAEAAKPTNTASPWRLDSGDGAAGAGHKGPAMDEVQTP